MLRKLVAEHEQHFYLRMIQRYFRPGIRWLDAGCGHSLVPKWVRGAKEIEHQFLTQAELVIGVDKDPWSLAAPAEIQRFACDLERLAFPGSTFDLITCNMVVEHLSRPDVAFQEFFRVLKSDGTVIILTPNLYHWANLVSRLTPYWFHRTMLRTLWGADTNDVFPTKYRCNTEKVLRKTLLSAGFSQVTAHLVPGRPRLVRFGPLVYIEWLLYYGWSLKFPHLREILCAVARKSPL
jgi:ubiquinone/menaquinone biosynthesis C-methylase UbiE